MKKRGRPKMDGVQPVWMGDRAFHILCAFHAAREQGEKYEVALAQTVELLRKDFPDMPMSITAVKRVLADLQPEGAQEVFSVRRTGKRKFDIYLGPRPIYERKNAKIHTTR
jgi:hypothetical protein